MSSTRDNFFERLYAGEEVTCPVCDRKKKLKDRPINSSMAWVLIWLFKTHGSEWTHILNALKDSKLPNSVVGDFQKLRHWKLLERHPSKRGVYRVTQYGEQFLRGELKVKRSYIAYNNKIIRFNEPRVSIRDALGTRFNYEELMSSTVALTYTKDLFSQDDSR